MLVGGLLLGFSITCYLSLSSYGTLLCNDQASDLDELIGLGTSQLVRRLGRLHLPFSVDGLALHVCQVIGIPL